ncbi:MAG: hypothetical protein ACRDCI_13825 [Plesiomonas shigelloides]
MDATQPMSTTSIKLVTRSMAKKRLWFTDAGYQVAENREELADVKAEWAISMCPSKLILKKASS